ncbi:MAG: YdiU family protein [Pseudomonadota bacterium]
MTSVSRESTSPSKADASELIEPEPFLPFDNQFIEQFPGAPELGACWSPVAPTPVQAPQLVAYSAEVAALLDLDVAHLQHAQTVAVLAGNRIAPGSTPYATAYAGHQFGQWAGQLGDGRVIVLGETVNRAGQRFEIQLKGAGPTPYSRRGDGRAVLRSSVREFLCSEAMHHLGIPTTRALSLVSTGDGVLRDLLYDGNPRIEPGAIVCRVAPSFLRFGHFQFPCLRADAALLRQLLDFTMRVYFPDLWARQDPKERDAQWFCQVCERTAYLMAQWMRVGFVHGVMNTDNLSILGLSIDYGPYGWLEDVQAAWTPNTTDASGRRYCFARQPEMARWNLERLAEALALLEPETAFWLDGLAHYDAVYQREIERVFAGKLGFQRWCSDDDRLLDDLFLLLEEAEVDFTEFFCLLSALSVDALLDAAQLDCHQLATFFKNAFYREALYTRFLTPLAHWLMRYVQRITADVAQYGIAATQTQRQALMRQHNPRFILRNYLVHAAIEQAEQGDFSQVHALLSAARHPYDDQHPEALLAKRPEWARHQPGASMLSCSS